MIPLVLAAIDPPADLASWVGAIVLTAVVTGLIARFTKAGDKVDKVQADAATALAKVTADAALAKAQVEADWKSELRATLKTLVDGQNSLTNGQALQSQTIATMQGRLDALEERQKEQAAAHLRAIDLLKQESNPRTTRRGK